MPELYAGRQPAPFARRELPLEPGVGPADEALARLHFLYEQTALGGIVTAPAGCGKTALLRRFAADVRKQSAPVAYVSGCEADERQFLTQLLHGWALGPRAAGADREGAAHERAALASAWRSLADQLQSWRLEEQRAVVLLDDMDDAPALRGPVERLVALAIAARAPVLLIVTSRPETAPALGPRLLGALELRIDLGPWDEAATRDFIAQRLASAAATAPRESEQLAFTDGAVAQLHALSGGAPRQVSLLAELALVAGAAAGQTTINEGTIEGVFYELASLEAPRRLEAVLG